MGRSLLLGLALVGCSSDNKVGGDSRGTDSGSPDDGTHDGVDGGACSTTGNLELVPLDIWGRDVEHASLSLDHDPDLLDDPEAGPGVVLIPLGDEASSLQVYWTLADHDDLGFRVDIRADGSVSVGDPSSGRLETSSQTRTLGGMDCRITTVYAGLDHSWFASTGHAWSNNEVELLIGGQDFWVAVADDLQGARERVSWTTWFWMSDFELTRSEHNFHLSETQRWPNTIMGMMEDLPGVDKRVLINRFWDENTDFNEYLNTDSELRDVANDTRDDFEVMLQGNPVEVPVTGQYHGEPADFDFVDRVADNPRYSDRFDEQPERAARVLEIQGASWHQKLMVIDGEVAYVTGMNTKSTDYDTPAHRVFEPLRMDFDASESDRQDVADELSEPDYGPRRDYGIRVVGPAVHDVEDIFRDRWEQAIDGHDLYYEGSSRFDLSEVLPEPPDGVPSQVVATLPPPYSEMSILESHSKAFSQAHDYIFVEDQYFRSPITDAVIVEAMTADPDLRLIVVTKDVSMWDGGAKYTYLADQTFLSLFPNRYLLLQLVSSEMVTEEGWVWDDAEVVVQAIDTHSKLRLVDDKYLSVGSCNMNNRGYEYEGELDVSVFDEGFTTDARRTVFEQLVGPDWAPLLSDDAANNFDVLAMAAESNQEILDWWDEYADDYDDLDEAESDWARYQPSGFVVPLRIDSDYRWDVGPDAF